MFSLGDATWEREAVRTLTQTSLAKLESGLQMRPNMNAQQHTMVAHKLHDATAEVNRMRAHGDRVDRSAEIDAMRRQKEQAGAVDLALLSWK